MVLIVILLMTMCGVEIAARRLMQVAKPIDADIRAKLNGIVGKLKKYVPVRGNERLFELLAGSDALGDEAKELFEALEERMEDRAKRRDVASIQPPAALLQHAEVAELLEFYAMLRG